MLLLAGCAKTPEGDAALVDQPTDERCIASRYDEPQRLAWGGRLDHVRQFVAHKTHPQHAVLLITRTDTAAAIQVPVLDRGPYVRGRCVDLSPAAANAIGLYGLAPVTVRRVR